MSAAGEWLARSSAQLPIYSLAKPFIAAAIAKLDINHALPVSTWIGRERLPRSDDITVAQLLNHTSGIPDYASLAAYGHAINAGAAPWSDEEFSEHTLAQPLLFEPGQRFAYSNPGYRLLTEIIRIESALALGPALQSLVFDPLRMRDTQLVTGIFAEDLPHYPAEWVWHGLIVSTPDDCVRFMSSSSARLLTQRPIDVEEAHPLWRNPHYAQGVMIEPEESFGHLGSGPIYSAACLHFEESGLTGCVLGRGVEADNLHLLRHAIAQATGQPT